MLRRALLLTGLTIFLSSCAATGGSSVKFDVPERPPLPKAAWTERDEMFCVDEAGARAVLEREAIRDAYEAQLKAAIDGCNKALE